MGTRPALLPPTHTSFLRGRGSRAAKGSAAARPRLAPGLAIPRRTRRCGARPAGRGWRRTPLAATAGPGAPRGSLVMSPRGRSDLRFRGVAPGASVAARRSGALWWGVLSLTPPPISPPSLRRHRTGMDRGPLLEQSHPKEVFAGVERLLSAVQA